MTSSGTRSTAYGLRQQATRLRRIADQLNAEADTIERASSTAPLLGGTPLRNAAVEVLAEAGAAMHYTDLLAEIEHGTGCRVRGEDPACTLLANIVREPRIRQVGARSGLYELAEVA